MTGPHLIFRTVAGLLFGGLGFLFLGLTLLMIYESIAVWTRLVPTISEVTSFELLKHPIWWIIIACGLSFVFGALVTHFSHWTPVPTL
jgi:polyferredoxin